jgi:hypothetical protein
MVAAIPYGRIEKFDWSGDGQRRGSLSKCFRVALHELVARSDDQARRLLRLRRVRLSREEVVAYSGEVGRAFRLKSATCSA